LRDHAEQSVRQAGAERVTERDVALAGAQLGLGEPA